MRSIALQFHHIVAFDGGPACADLNSRTKVRTVRWYNMPHAFRQTHTMKIRSDQTLVRDLRELIAALDRRMPRIERDGEHDIARDAQGLKRAALKRIGELERLRRPRGTPTASQETA
jgi:hypothetical protein